MNELRARIGTLALLASLALMLPGCGYALQGKGNFLPAWIHVVAVPPLANRSSVPDVDVAMTDAVRAEFQNHRFKTVPEAEGADAVLTATIASVRVHPVQFNANRQATRNSATVTAEVEFKDKTGKVWWSNRNAQFTEEYDVATSTTANDPSNFFGQDQVALQRLAKSFAQSIVTSILEAF